MTHTSPPDAAANLTEHYRTRRRLMRWRFVALLAIGVAFFTMTYTNVATTQDDPYIARVEIYDIIVQDRERSTLLRDLADDPLVKAVIIDLNSPGGTTYGGEQLYKDLAYIKDRKPVTTVMGTIATSAAYMAAMGTDYIVAGETTLTGSIGVIMQTAEITGMLEKIGIAPTTIKSGDQKAIPNPLEPLTQRQRQEVQDSIDETFIWFMDLVKRHRNLDAQTVATLSDGRVVTGRRAMDTGMIDAIGAEPEAREWLALTHDVGPDLDAYSVWPIPEPVTVIDMFMEDFLEKSQLTEALMLDGLIALWHPVTR